MRLALNISAAANVVLAVGFVAVVLSTSQQSQLGSAMVRAPTHMVVPVTPSMRMSTRSSSARSGMIAPQSTARLDFLEASPYYDQSKIPVNTHKNKAPLTAKVVSVERIVGPKATGETCNIVIDHEGKMPYWEGQSAGVIPPGIDPKRNKPYGVRLYSIASTRYGDKLDGKTMTLCVRRATYWDPELGREDPAKKGVCSNYLCDAKPGTELALTGPSGKVMLMPEEKPETPIIMLATGTGIAPYRGFLRRLFVENTEAAEKFKGLAWLFLGVANSDALLYDDDWKAIQEKYPDKFRYDVALSREQKNKKGGKMYIQDKIEEYGKEVFELMTLGGHIYFCGLKGMMPGVLEAMQNVAKDQGLDWDTTLQGWKKNGQWHVEVY
mmetsp:Transcript_28283/g.39326  ORF Transcript_28283/g.39326 Transcript_28283/m.39326 type:complete len:381 (+) Transcript_28283:97-1239(+)|eukprot:CAMPEP_0184478800 /NCGR_PEP_ID=MMETSP0113_2-20130426/725_1 /TAXON_ID=91329 /ORGANISM="Norrisiella sphaerica, Strain BC52" /LENGTH=380 /DNA_ID=CAMNT_0026856707 /DNA_START=85 /DNA_END=1227 /DNA_ORIENTATION=+